MRRGHSPRLRPRLAATLAAVLALAVTVPLALPAHAAAGAVTTSNWYYDDPGMSASAAAQSPTPSGVPMGDLGIGYQVGGTAPVSAPVTVPRSEPDKITGLIFDLGPVGSGSQVSSFNFAMPVDVANDPASMAQVAGMPPAVVACLSNRMILPGPGSGPSPYQGVPSYDCGTKDPGVYDAATSSYKFSATNIAQAWADDANDGLVVLPDPAVANPTTYTLSFLPASKITGSISGTPAAAATSTAGAAPVATDAAPAPETVASQAAAPTSSAPVAKVQPGAGSPAAPVANPVAAAPVGGAVIPAPVSAGAPVSAAAPAPAVATVPDAAAPAGDAGLAPAPASAGGAPVSGVRAAAASKPISVSSGIGVVGYVFLVLVVGAVLAATSLGLARPAEATGTQNSRLSKLLSGS